METKTIEERAEKVTSKFSYRNGYQTAKDAYIAGATEQREIDIQRAVEVFAKIARDYLLALSPDRRRGRDVKYEVENFIQAMKGEQGMEKHIRIEVDYTYDFEEDDNYTIEQDIKEGLAERLGLSPEDIDVEIE